MLRTAPASGAEGLAVRPVPAMSILAAVPGAGPAAGIGAPVRGVRRAAECGPGPVRAAVDRAGQSPVRRAGSTGPARRTLEGTATPQALPEWVGQGLQPLYAGQAVLSPRHEAMRWHRMASATGRPAASLARSGCCPASTYRHGHDSSPPLPKDAVPAASVTLQLRRLLRFPAGSGSVQGGVGFPATSAIQGPGLPIDGQPTKKPVPTTDTGLRDNRAAQCAICTNTSLGLTMPIS